MLVPFDPDEVMRALWCERYRRTSAARRLATRLYYGIRPALPRSAQLAFRRRIAGLQASAVFPRWPVESGLDDLYRLLLGHLGAVAKEPVPCLGAWPRPYKCAIVLTHDVETAAGLARVLSLAEMEADRGYVSSWNFVPRRYSVPGELLEALRVMGFEVGVHGLYHDGRDISSQRAFRRRLPEMQRYAKTWNAAGFRSPATHRNWERMSQLGFEYDSSYPDTDPYEPQPGGCCTWLPFAIGDIVELPITLPQDHTVFSILNAGPEIWQTKTAALHQRGGMVVALTHPDYLHDGALEGYLAFLDYARSVPGAWHALPRDVARWWRRRSASRLVRNGSAWEVTGPAAEEAQIDFAEPNPVTP